MRRVPQIVHPAAEKLQRAASPPRFRILPGALTCIMRYCAFTECFLLGHDAMAVVDVTHSVVRRARGAEFPESKFYGIESMSGLCRIFSSFRII